MATFQRLWNARHGMLGGLNDSLRQAEINKDRELRAAITIQSIRRAIVARRYSALCTKSCKAIQRIWRGFLAREYACHISMLRDKKRAHALWTRMATVIQKSFRAFYSRRYKHSYYERKAYLASVTAKDEKIRELSEAVAESQYQEREHLRQTQAEEEFTGLAKDLHHLVSTGSIPGVFNSPYNMEPVRAFGKPVESQIKSTFARSQYLKRHLMRSMGKARYTAIHGATNAMGDTMGSLDSAAYTHSSMPRPLEPLAEEAPRSRAA